MPVERTLSFFLLPGMMRLVRSSMLDVLECEYVQLARIKGPAGENSHLEHAIERTRSSRR
jgi:ABC-type dipeptide/oligopeptide/nickel transport system permease component